MLWYIGQREQLQYIEMVILQDWHNLNQKAP